MELFKSCLSNVKEGYTGCTIEVKPFCSVSHREVWHSSEVINKVFMNNIHTAASLLSTGNNFTKMSLFANWFGLSFLSDSSCANLHALSLKVMHFQKFLRSCPHNKINAKVTFFPICPRWNETFIFLFFHIMSCFCSIQKKIKQELAGKNGWKSFSTIVDF